MDAVEEERREQEMEVQKEAEREALREAEREAQKNEKPQYYEHYCLLPKDFFCMSEYQILEISFKFFEKTPLPFKPRKDNDIDNEIFLMIQ